MAAAAARPLVSIQILESDMAIDGSAATNSLPLPDVMKAPIHHDLVNFVHALMRNNSRQPYAVSRKASHQTPPSPGVLDVPSHIFHVSPVAVPTVLVKVPSVTCIVAVENSEWNDWQVNALQERNMVENVYRWDCGATMVTRYVPPVKHGCTIDVLLVDKSLEISGAWHWRRPYNCPYAGSECAVTGDIPSLVSYLRDDHKVDMHTGCTFNHRYVKSNPHEVENATWMLTVSHPIHDRDYDAAALANNLSQAFRYSIYDNDDAEEICRKWIILAMEFLIIFPFYKWCLF